MSRMSPSKVTLGDHPVLCWSFVASPAMLRGGRAVTGCAITCRDQSKPCTAKHAAASSRTVWLVPVATTKSSGCPVRSISRIARTESRAAPQSVASSSEFTVTMVRGSAEAAKAAWASFVTINVGPRNSDSWLKRMALVTKRPCTWRKCSATDMAAAFDIP